ncbi:hypothetical protein chiPu_0021563 [Chiloscyllium punctatum]|uniref:Uncharacterized protein n=1 Tax=Chiloscyllium punctatum TaxID=137246 RepID=A0A401RHK8_CHIPU|nr:hypothetical protein [Chiloscyllium punctatum]
MMEQRCGFSPPFVRKQAVNASVPSLPLSEGPSSPRLFQRLPWRGLRMGQCPLSPILKRKFTVSCLTQRSASPHPGPAFKEKAVPSPPPNPTPPSSSPPSRAKCPTRSPSPPQRETVGRSLCGQPANGGAPSSVLGYKDLTVRDARRRDMDLDELLKKASAFLHRNPVGRVDPHVALKLHPVQTVTISEQRTEISQQADNSDGRSEGLPTVLECLNSHFWLGSVLPNSRVPTSTQDPGEPFTSPPWNSTPGIRRPCYSLQPGQETKAQNSLQNPYPRGPLDGKPCQDDEWPHSGIVGLQSCSLIPTRSARIESGIPRLDPKGTLRETRVPPSGHGSLDTAKHSTSVQLKCNNLVPTQDIRVPQPEGTLGLRDHLKPSPTQSPDLSQCTKQDDELPTPTLYTHLQRRLQRGRSRVAPSLNEAGSPLGLGASRRKLQDNSKPIECLRTPREAKRRHFHEG